MQHFHASAHVLILLSAALSSLFVPLPSRLSSRFSAIPFANSVATTVLFGGPRDRAWNTDKSVRGQPRSRRASLAVRSTACFTCGHSSKNSQSNQTPGYSKSRWASRRIWRKIISVSNNTSVVRVNTLLVGGKCRAALVFSALFEFCAEGQIWKPPWKIKCYFNLRGRSKNCSLNTFPFLIECGNYRHEVSAELSPTACKQAYEISLSGKLFDRRWQYVYRDCLLTITQLIVTRRGYFVLPEHNLTCAVQKLVRWYSFPIKALES